MDSPLHVLSDLSERLNYNVTDFPIYVKKCAKRGLYVYCPGHSPVLIHPFFRQGESICRTKIRLC